MIASVALGEGLAKNTAVKVLDLRDNRLSQPGGRAFAPAVSSWPSLHMLNLCDCLLSEEDENPQVTYTFAKGSNRLLRFRDKQP
jgi:Ran GTPase-activating protein 1